MALTDLGNVKGATGATGAQGPKGDAATISVGTTTTGAAGTNANVTNGGSSDAAIFNFTIPRGADGREFGETFNHVSNVSCPNATTTDVASITVPKGTYVVICKAIFQLTSASGSRKIGFSCSNGYASDATEVGGNPSGYTQIENSDIITLSGSTTIKAKATQSSGSAITVTGILRAIKISE